MMEIIDVAVKAAFTFACVIAVSLIAIGIFVSMLPIFKGVLICFGLFLSLILLNIGAFLFKKHG